jgi:precorrin-2 dehydrogenase / sirohydrochlorin ferrochelatase
MSQYLILATQYSKKIMNVYPIYLTRLHEMKTILIGGNHEAERKAGELLERDAQLTVISPLLTEKLLIWAEEGRFELISREYREGDLEGAFLVIAAEFTGDTNRRVYREAEDRCILVNVMDDIPHANFSFGSIVKRGPLTISISTSGAGSPAPGAPSWWRQRSSSCSCSRSPSASRLLRSGSSQRSGRA